MNCPYCGKPLTEGYLTIPARTSLFWTLEKSNIWNAPATLEGSMRLDKDSLQNLLTGTSIPARQCAACKKIILDFEP